MTDTLGNSDYLSPDALASTDAQLLAALAASPPRPRRGRPPGSKNKPKVDENGQIVPPRSPSTPKSATPTDDLAKKRLAKAKTAQEWQNKIMTEANEGLMQLLIGMGVPTGLLYEPGYAPAAKIPNSHYTPLALKIAIPPNHAKVWGLTLAEFQSSDMGGKLTEVVAGDSPVRLIILALASLGLGAQYVKGLMELRKDMDPFIRAYQARKQQEANQATGV